MRSAFVLPLLLLSTTLSAQLPPRPCLSDAIEVQDACQKAFDLFQFVGPQLGSTLSGGGQGLGDPGAIGSAGHFSLGIRLQAVRAVLPRAAAIVPSIRGAVPTTYDTFEQIVAFPVIDGALGVFPGVSLGGVRLFAVDALGGATYARGLQSGDVRVEVPHGGVKFGYGARVAVVQEGRVTPALVTSWNRRGLPTVDLIATPSQDLFAIRKVSLTVDSWRAAVGKSLGRLSLQVGAGEDRVVAGAQVEARLLRNQTLLAVGPVAADQVARRRTVYGEAALRIGPTRLVAGAGQLSPVKVATYNSFVGPLVDSPRSYASLSLAIAR